MILTAGASGDRLVRSDIVYGQKRAAAWFYRASDKNSSGEPHQNDNAADSGICRRLLFRLRQPNADSEQSFLLSPQELRWRPDEELSASGKWQDEWFRNLGFEGVCPNH